MSIVRLGDRVIALASIKDNVAEIFGYGTYIGEFVPDYEGERGTMSDTLKKLQIPNPTIQLDNGELVYGCECWWSSESNMKNKLKDCEIKTITIQDFVNSIKNTIISPVKDKIKKKHQIDAQDKNDYIACTPCEQTQEIEPYIFVYENGKKTKKSLKEIRGNPLYDMGCKE